MNAPTDADYGKQQAQAQYESVAAMVAAADLDWERLEELREERGNLPDDYALDPVVGGFIWKCEAKEVGSDRFDTEEGATHAAWAHANPHEAEEFGELEQIASDYDSADDARERIQDDPLSVEVRSGWASPGDTLVAEEFCILLCTGGPAVRIRGELDMNTEPTRAWIEYQDWGTPWTQYFGAEQETLLAYCRHFHFGE